MPYTRKLPRILPLPFRLAALARRRSGRGEGRGEGSLCVVHPTVPSVYALSPPEPQPLAFFIEAAISSRLPDFQPQKITHYRNRAKRQPPQ